jgi:hypothetical protein
MLDCWTESVSLTARDETRQATNVTMRPVRVTTVASKSKNYYIFWVCVCSLNYPACKAHAPCYTVIRDKSGSKLSPCYTVIRDKSGSTLSPCYTVIRDKSGSTLSHKRHEFRKRKEVTEHKMCVLIFCTTFVWNILHSSNTWARYDKCT